VLEKKRSFRLLKLLWKQLTAPLPIVLLLAGLATLFLGEWVDALVIATALAINVLLGMYQEGKASRVFDELTQALEHKATVIREGAQKVIPSHEVVPGDIIVLEAGKTVPADARLTQVFNLSVNESAFTGEWLPVKKSVGKAHVRVAREATNLVWGGTIVAEGSARAVVTETGYRTAFGKLAAAVQVIDETQTPLTASVKKLARAMIILIVCVLVGPYCDCGCSCGHA